MKRPNLDWGQYSWDPETFTLEVDGIASSAFDDFNTQWRVALQDMFTLKPLMERCRACEQALDQERHEQEMLQEMLQHLPKDYRRWRTNRRMTSYYG